MTATPTAASLGPSVPSADAGDAADVPSAESASNSSDSVETDVPPATRAGRMAAIDVARGIAMLGMVSVHVAWADRGWWSDLASGRAAVLFFTLSGMTMSMLSRRGATTASPGQLRRRGVVLFLGGMTMMSTIWATTILHVYGLMFLAAPWLLRRRTRTLMAITALAFVCGPIVVLLWNDVRIDFHSATVAPTVYFEFKRMLTDHYALLIWTGFFAAGIAVARMELSRRRTAIRLVVAGVTMTTVVTLAHALWAPTVAAPDVAGGNEIEWADLWRLAPHANTAPWALQALGIALAVIGLVAAAPPRPIRLLRPIGALGSMTLSAYIIHTFLVQDVWAWSATGHPEREPYVLGLICAVLVIGAVVVQRRWGKGPFERGLSWLIEPRASGSPSAPAGHGPGAA